MKKLSLILLSIFTIVTISSSRAQTISPARKVNWALAGLTGNAPEYQNFRNITDYGGAGDNITPNDAALRAAILSLANQNGIIYFPAGTFLFNAPVQLRSGLVLQGQSAATSILKFNLGGSSNLISVAGSSTGTVAAVTTSLYKDQTSLTVDNTNGFSVNDYIKIYQNDSALIYSDWALESVGQFVRITQVTGTTITFSSPLRRNYLISQAPKIRRFIMATDVGIEYLKIKRMDASAAQTSNINFFGSAGCWVKGIESDSCNYAHIQVSNSTNISVTGSYFHGAFAYGGGGQGYGVTCEATSGECLIENNIFKHLRHAMLVQSGANGNVYGYNYSLNPFKSEAFPYDLSGDIVLHGNYPYSNLFEENLVQNIIIDASHGANGPFNTIFRNRAESYGLIMSSGAGDSTNLVGNEITESSFGKGNYIVTGNGNFEFGNNKRGTLIPSGTSSPADNSSYYPSTPWFWNVPGAWPAAGLPNTINTGTIPAKQRYNANINLTFANPNLAGISLSMGTLLPAFTPGLMLYAASVPGNVTSVLVSPTLFDTLASIKVNGNASNGTTPVTLLPGINVITILVTARDGITTKIYSLAITRAATVSFSGKVFLQGAFNLPTGKMNNTLNTLGILQAKAASQPFAATYNYTGTESVPASFFSLHRDIVDWVLIELRSSLNPSFIVATRAAFVKQDGTLVDTGGIATQISFPGVAPANYYVAIRHRNHLGIRSANPLDFSSPAYYDFTTASNKTFQNQLYTSTIFNGAVWCMRGGNANGNNNVKYNGPDNDPNQVLNGMLAGMIAAVVNNVYAAEDVNMNGTVKWTGPDNDQNFILNIVLGGLLGNILSEQL